tara:strand:- start:3569 stop:5374 length:1806 start_codon:yes stop_codon:yes gene_type:complete
MNTTFLNKIIKSLINHNREDIDISKMINESTNKINKIKLTEEEKQYITKKYSDYVNIIKHSINEDSDFDQKVSNKRKFIRNVVDSVVGESKLIWKPTQLTFNRDNGWNDVRVAVPFNNQPTTLAQYFKGEGTHQDLFKAGFENFVKDIYALSKGETYYVYELYLKEMFTRISNFIKENTINDEPDENPFAINEDNMFKRFGRKLYSKYSKIPNVSEKFVEKMANYIEQRYDEVINVTWTYDIFQKMELKVYIDEDDGHRTDIGVHPLEQKIKKELYTDWHIAMDENSHLWLDIKVINLNKDTKLRGSVIESINEDFNNYDETIPNEEVKNFIDKVVNRMVEKTEMNLYASDYDPWTTSSPWFGNFITPQFPNDKRYKFNITWLLDEHFERMSSFIKYFANELIEAYGFSTRGELEYFDSEYLKKLKDKVEILKIPLIEKRRKQKEEYNKKYNISESKKDAKKEEDEIQRAVQDLSRLHNFNTSVSELTRGIVDSSPQPLSSEIWDVLENTESNEIEKGDFDSVFRLAQRYGKSNPLKLIKKLKEGSYNPPIIVRYDDNYRLVAGNTRLCTASALGITPEVLIVDLNKPFPVESVSKIKNII